MASISAVSDLVHQKKPKDTGAFFGLSLFKAIMRGDFSVGIVALVSAATVRYIAMPIYEGHVRACTPAVSARFPAGLLEFYDPSRDDELNLMMLSALSGYVVMSFFICSTLDLFPRATARFKVQGEKNYFTASEWLQTVSVVIVNLFLFSWFATLPAWHLQRSGVLRGGSPLTTLTDSFSLGR